MRHRAQTLIGEWVVGYYVANLYSGTHYIATENRYHEINPETLSIETQKLDSAGNMIFGSFELDGVMTQGGDVVSNGISVDSFNVIYDKQYATFYFRKMHNTKFWEHGLMSESDKYTIIGKQSEVQNDK